MSLSIFDTSISQAQKALESLSNIIKKGEAAPNAASLLEARIYPDMYPLTFQVHVATDLSALLVTRLSGAGPTGLEYSQLKTYADLHARIAKVQEILAKADKEAINNRQTEAVSASVGPNKFIELPASVYALGYVLPNIFFHVTTAYDILRKEGLPMTKSDYLGAFLGDYAPRN